MAVVQLSAGFGSDPEQLLTVSSDAIFREIRGSASRVDIRGVRAELDSGFFGRSAANATVNGGLVIVARMGILRGPQGKTPPVPDVSTGITPRGFRQETLKGFELLWQKVVFAWGDTTPSRFEPGEISAVGDRSLYVVLGGCQQIVAGTLAAPGAISDPATGVFSILSVAGIDYSANPTQDLQSQFRSLPRYDVSLSDMLGGG